MRQSSTTKGWSARALASWMHSASSSLPVPVSPSRTMDTSVAESRSHRASTFIMRGLLDATRPSDATRLVFAGSGAAASASIALDPTRRRTPGERNAATMRPSPKKDPFVEPRSVTSTPSSVSSIEAWRRDTVRSVSLRSQSAPVPTSSAPDDACSATWAPASGPSTTRISKLVAGAATVVACRRVSPWSGGSGDGMPAFYHVSRRPPAS